MRKVTVPEKFIRLAIVGALCVNVYGCGVSTGRDLTLAGAVQRFDDRRAAVRAEQAVLEGVDTKRAAQLKPTTIVFSLGFLFSPSLCFR